jgi:hypothetical protein
MGSSSCVSLSPSITETQTTEDFDLSEITWSTYQDPELGYSLQYPSSWFYFTSADPLEENSLSQIVLFSSALGNTSPQIRSEDEEARLVVNSYPTKSSDDVETWLLESPLMEFPSTRLDINGFEAIRIVTPPENEDDLSTHVFLFLIAPGRRYSLVGTISAGSHAAVWSQVIDYMLISFNPDS